jgi:hypothetical protein
MNFVLGFLYALAAQILTFLQLQGQFKYEWAKENPFPNVYVMEYSTYHFCT